MNYEQHNEVSTSYKHNYECKSDFFYEEKDEKCYARSKAEESQMNFTTPFSVKDILNINQTYYERNDVWKPERGQEYERLYHQSSYCSEYLNQMYPMHNGDYWSGEYENKEGYYNYNTYCHNLYHHEQYQETPQVTKLDAMTQPPGIAEAPPPHLPLGNKFTAMARKTMSKLN